MSIEKFEATIQERLKYATDFTEQWNYLEVIQDTLNFLQIDNHEMDGMLANIKKQIDSEYEKEYLIKK